MAAASGPGCPLPPPPAAGPDLRGAGKAERRRRPGPRPLPGLSPEPRCPGRGADQPPAARTRSLPAFRSPPAPASAGSWGCPRRRGPGPSPDRSRSLPDSRAEGGRVGPGEGDALRQRGSRPQHPRSSPSSTPRGRGRTPTGRFPWEAGGGRRGLVPTPSLTLGREVGERGRRGAPNNKEPSGERQPLPREPGVAAAGPAGTPLPPTSPGLRSRLRGGSQRQCRRLGRCDSDPRVPRDPPNTQTHSG